MQTDSAVTALSADDPFVRWERLLGSLTHDSASAVAVDGTGNVYLTGSTAKPASIDDFYFMGSPEPNAGSHDVFVASYTATGERRWVHQLGSPAEESGTGIAVDGSGNIYVARYTRGTLPGSLDPKSGGGSEVFIASYTSAGVKRWVRQLGSLSNSYATDPNGNRMSQNVNGTTTHYAYNWVYATKRG